MHAASMATILLDLALILVVARAAGWVAVRAGMPAVVGEILAGVLLGPSLLGAEWSALLFPTDTRPYLSLLANIGLVLFMFVVGLELDVSLMRGRGRVAGSVSICSIVLPFTLGVALATQLAEHNAGGDFWPFALFIGAAMSVTAFPVLARILTDRNMHRTATGGLALACAAADDVLAWTLLAVVIAVGGGASHGDQSWVVALAVPFALAALLIVRPQLKRLSTAYRRAGRLTPSVLAYVLIGLLLFSATTEYLHVHFIFGAFLFGAIMPRENAAALRHDILVRLEQISVLLLLPVFFLVSGLNVNLRGLSADNGLQLVAILAVAIFGKFVGAYVGARLTGVRPWQASALGILMNTRGLTELIILNVGRELGLLSDNLFTMLVVMAVATTMMTGPLLRLAYPESRVARDIAEAERAALGGDSAAHRVVVVTPWDGSQQLAHFDTALALATTRRPAEIVLASFQRQRERRLSIGSGLTEELAEMTDLLERLEVLVRRGAEFGIEVRVIARLSADPATDTLSLIDSTAPDVVVLSASADVDATDSIAAATDRLTVSVPETTPSPLDARTIRAVWRPGKDGDAGVLVACRLAAAARAGLLLEAQHASVGRRFRAMRRQLTARGMRLADGPADEPVVSVGFGLGAREGIGVRGEAAAPQVDWTSDDLGLSTAVEADR